MSHSLERCTNSNIRVGMSSKIRKPWSRWSKCSRTSNIIHQQRTRSTSIIRSTSTLTRESRRVREYRVMDLKLSWPAVSQIWHFKFFVVLVLSSTTESIRAPNSTPIVTSCADWYRLSVNLSIKFDFPTPESPVHEYSYLEERITDDDELESAYFNERWDLYNVIPWRTWHSCWTATIYWLCVCVVGMGKL